MVRMSRARLLFLVMIFNLLWQTWDVPKRLVKAFEIYTWALRYDCTYENQVDEGNIPVEIEVVCDGR